MEPAFVALTLDGSVICAREGQTVLHTAREHGVVIPALCDHETLPAPGTCRLCLVRIGGRIVASCTTPVAGGMVVESVNDELERLRQGIAGLLMAEGHHVCEGCRKDGRCELQTLARRYGVDAVSESAARDPAACSTLPHLTLHHDRCIQCLRCVRGVQGHRGQDIFGFLDHGQRLRIAVDVTDADALSEDTARRAEAACPVGALIHRPSLIGPPPATTPSGA